ncbi:MAG: 1-acyl-sn-glycerol-3-phosphate acyltransferase [Pseudomonadota bacterium]
MIGSLLYVVWLYSWGIILGTIAIPALILPRRVTMWFIRLYARLVLMGLRLFCGVKVEFRGQQHIPEGACLIAAKHQAMLDVFVPFLIFRDPIMVMKRELLWYPIFGWSALRTGMLPIDREGGAKTMKRMLRAAAKLMPQSGGRQMVIYPEGTRVRPGAAPDYKAAGLRAFYKSLNVPLVPFATNAGLCWPAKGLKRTPGTIVYEVLPPISVGENPKQVLVTLEEQLEAACDTLLDEGLTVQGLTRTDLI